MSFLDGSGWLQVILYFVALFAFAKPLGGYMAKVYSNQSVWLEKIFAPLEDVFYRLAGVDRNREMDWKQYCIATLVFSLGGFVLLYAILRWQAFFPFNPAQMANLTPDLAFDTAASFTTNTNWQSYGGESTLSYFSQMAGLTIQNFLSPAVGMAVMAAFIRGLARKNSKTIGNFWVDMVRSNLYILLPLAVVWAILLGSQGVVQSFGDYAKVPLIESIKLDEKKDDKGVVTQKAETVTEQTIAVGPVASQVAIKQLGTNGGGFFNVNSAHPLENPTPFSNFLEMLAILLIPAALCYTFGAMIGDTRQGWAVLAAMTVIFVPLLLICIGAEQQANPHIAALGVQGPNMEGKEMRFGIVNSAIWASATTAASNGSVNSMHDSFTPIGGMIPMLLMQFSEVIYGGVGSGLYGMLIYVVITVFIAGLMVGRTPEYMGKKIQSFEMKMASVVILIPPLLALFGTSLAVMTEAGRAGISNPGAQGFSEILYAFSSAGNNNGSAFAGLSANTPFYNTWLGICMLFSRYWLIVPTLAIAGSLAAKNTVPHSAGTLSTHTPLFILFLVGIVVMVGVLTFVPALALGPVVEHLKLFAH